MNDTKFSMKDFVENRTEFQKEIAKHAAKLTKQAETPPPAAVIHDVMDTNVERRSQSAPCQSAPLLDGPAVPLPAAFDVAKFIDIMHAVTCGSRSPAPAVSYYPKQQYQSIHDP